MLGRRNRFLWGALLLGTVVAGALARAPEDTLLWKALFDASHTLFGGLLALFGLQMILAWKRTTEPTSSDQWLALAGSICVGLAFELVQFFLPRDADPLDLLRDALGAAAALLFAWALQRRPPSRDAPRLAHRILAAGIALLFLGGAFASLVRLTWMIHQRNEALPLVLRPGASWQQPFLAVDKEEWETIARPHGWQTTPGRPEVPQVARVTFHAGPYPGFAIRETAPDWSRFETLVLETFSNMPAPIEIELRIDDSLHDQTYGDRFNHILHVEPGGQVFRIPLENIRRAPANREMDMARIRRLVIFMVENAEPFTIDFGPIWLE